MFVLGFYGVGTGDPTALIFGADYNGELCGKGNNTGLKARYMVNPLEILYAANNLGSAVSGAASLMGSYNLRDAKSYCVAECPQTANTAGQVNWFCEPSTATDRAAWVAADYDTYASLSPAEKQSSNEFKGPCYPVLFDTVNTYLTCQYYGEGDDHALAYLNSTNPYSANFNNVYNGAALADFVQTMSNQVDSMLSGPLATVERYIDDFTTGWKVVLVAGAVCPIVLSVAFLLFLRYFTKIFAYTTILLVNVLSIVVTIYLFLKAGVIGSDQITAYTDKVNLNVTAISNYADPAKSNQDVLEVFAYISLFITIVFFIFSLIMLRRIKVAIGVMKVATSAFGKMPHLIFFPIFPALCMVALFAYWLPTMVYLYSSGELKLQSCTMESSRPPQLFCADASNNVTCHCGYSVSWDRNLQGMLAYYLFGFLWGSQWIVAMCSLILACIFVQYYFKGGDYNGVTSSPILAASKKMVWYHTGTAALGSFFVAILQFIRIVVRFVVHRLKKLHKNNPLVKYVGYYVEYCLWYLQKCIEWLNRNAYIMTAIEGTSFCKSAWNALALIVKKITAVAEVNIVGDIMLFLGKLCVSLGSGVIAFLMLDDDNFNYGDEKVSSPLFIVIVVTMFAYLIATIFMSIVELGMDTILFCYCKDCDDHSGTPVNAPPALIDALGVAKKVKKMQAEEAAQRAERAGQ